MTTTDTPRRGAPATSGLVIDHVTVSFRGFIAVDSVSLDVPSGTTLGLVGESGSGKSTVARVVVGSISPDSGTVRLGEQPLHPRRDLSERRTIQMVPQDPYSSLNPRMTVRQMLAEALRYHHVVPRRRIMIRCAELLDMVRLSASSLDRHPSEFSGGQRQRLAIARALSIQPSILIADEPTSSLDVSVQATVLDLLSGLQRELGLTMVFISHDLGVINAVSDHVAVMRQGRVIETAEREQFFADPREEYSRELLEVVPRLV